MGYESRYTPRDRVLDTEVVEEYTARWAVGASAWELYYSDGSDVKGTTQAQWDAAPVNDVQILIWQMADDQSLHVMHGSDVYELGGVAKYGKWMHDPTFYQMLDEVPVGSPLMNGL